MRGARRCFWGRRWFVCAMVALHVVSIGVAVSLGQTESAGQNLRLRTHAAVARTSELKLTLDPKTGQIDFHAPVSPDGEALDFVKKVEITSQSGVFGDTELDLASGVTRISDHQLVLEKNVAFADVFLGSLQTAGLDASAVLRDITIQATMADGVVVDVTPVLVPGPSTNVLSVVGLCGLFGLMWSRRLRNIA